MFHHPISLYTPKRSEAHYQCMEPLRLQTIGLDHLDLQPTNMEYYIAEKVKQIACPLADEQISRGERVTPSSPEDRLTSARAMVRQSPQAAVKVLQTLDEDVLATDPNFVSNNCGNYIKYNTRLSVAQCLAFSW